jgi:acyl-CoA thioester hydrolase
MIGGDRKNAALDRGRVFTHAVRVRYADVDRMGVAYHTRILEWFEAARTEMLREMGLPYKDLEARGLLLPVIEAECRYFAPALYDDLIEVRTRIGELTRLKIELRYEVLHPVRALRLAEGRTLHCFANHQGKPVRADREIAAWLERHARA